MSILPIRRGDTELLDFTIENLTAEQAEQATLKFTAKTSKHAATATITKLDATIALDGLVATVTLDPEDTAELPSRTVRLVYDLQATLNDAVYTLDEGTLVVKADVTT